jgi:hypothetical protein
MRTMAFTLMALSVCAFARAVDEGQWINLFDGETTFGWTSLGDVEWTVEDGALTSGSGTGGLIATTSQFQDFELTAKVQLKAGCTSGIAFRAALDGHPTENGSSVLWLSEDKSSRSPWRDVHIRVVGDNFHVMLDGQMVEQYTAGSRRLGHIALLYHHNGSAKVAIRDVRLRPIGLTPLFNGENLDGWNIIPDRKSVFSVVDGALNIKDGNGQIETAGTYKNFVLQLDIISHGEHLNSGVFFRGPVGVFWKGYESQVRNQWGRNDRTRPVDYGTGGNYGNQAARKVVSSDGEWFNKTVVCNGNHSAVWINGYQVSDFLDTRPVHPDYNAKEGYVGEAGTIHLQGHDPTTDLSFKNINLQEYPN